MTWPLWLGLAVFVLALTAVGLRAWGARRWVAAMRVLTASLEAGRIDDKPAGPATLPVPLPLQVTLPAPASARPVRYDARELDGLPAPVQRYFRAVLKDGQPLIKAATIDMAGTFNLSSTGEQWKPFTSTQRVTTRRPGFIWDAEISMLPGLRVRVVDSCVSGRGLLRATIEGLFTMADVRGEGEIARGEFMRWAAEAVWYPTALLPSQGVRWAAVDDRSAQATFADGPLTLSLLFGFDDAGLIGSFRAEARGGGVGREMVMAPWEGSLSNCQACDGVLVPFTGEVAWRRPDGRRPYFRGTVTVLSFELL